jgi:hypothetical protein
MDPAVIVFLAGVAIAVLAIAGYLLVIALLLNRVSFTVGTILIGVRSIAHQVEPVAGVVGKLHQDTTAIESALAGLLPADQLPAASPRASGVAAKALR